MQSLAQFRQQKVFDKQVKQNALLNPTEAHQRTSNKFGLVKTQEIIKSVESHGFELKAVTAAKVRREDYEGFQKHAIFFNAPWTNNDREVQQLMLVNDHRGMCSLRFYAGFFAHACLNQLSYADKQCPAIKLRHGVNVLEELKHVLPTLRDFMLKGQLFTNQLKDVTTSYEDRKNFAKLATDFATESIDTSFVDSASVLHAYREIDRADTGFNVLNRVQENVLKGLFNYVTLRKDRKLDRKLYKTVKAKPIKAIERRLDVNRFLMTSAQNLFLN